MSTKSVLLVLLLLCAGVSPSFALDDRLECFNLVASPSRASAQAIARATAVFVKKSFGWQNYKTEVMESDSHWLVEFWQPEKETTYDFHRSGWDWDCHPGWTNLDPSLVVT